MLSTERSKKNETLAYIIVSVRDTDVQNDNYSEIRIQIKERQGANGLQKREELTRFGGIRKGSIEHVLFE